MIERDVAPSAGTVDMKLEAVVIPVSDVKRAKRFYGALGWRLDADFVKGDAFQGVQFTPPGSSCSIQFYRERPLSAQAKREQLVREIESR